MVARKFTETVTVEGADEARSRLRGLDKAANAELRKAARAIVDEEIPRITAAAAASDKQSRLVAGAIRSRADRFPAIVAGGSKPLSTSRKGRKPKAQDVFFGAEFGGQGTKNWTEKTREVQVRRKAKGETRVSTRQVFAGVDFSGERTRATTAQFRPWKGRQGYWFWPTLRRDEGRIGEQWLGAVDAVVERVTRG